MFRIPTSLVWLAIAVTLVGCATGQPKSEKISAQTWNFPIEGQLGSVTVSDLATAISLVQPTKIYRVRVISRNRIEVVTGSGWHRVGDYDERGRHFMRRFYDESAAGYRIIERGEGEWRTNGGAVNASF